MKRTLAITIVSLLTITACNNSSNVQTANQTWKLDINPNTKKQTIDSVIAAWKKDSIDLSFSVLQYDSTGKLTKIKGAVNYIHNGLPMSGSFSSDTLHADTIILTNKPSIYLGGK